MKLNKKKKGFTLIELMAVIAIVAILAAVLVPTVSGYINRSKKTALLTQIRTAINAVESYNATATVEIDKNTTVAQLVERVGAANKPTNGAENGVLVTQELLKDKDVDKLADAVTVEQMGIINADKADAINKISVKDGKFAYTFSADSTVVIEN